MPDSDHQISQDDTTTSELDLAPEIIFCRSSAPFDSPSVAFHHSHEVRVERPWSTFWAWPTPRLEQFWRRVKMAAARVKGVAGCKCHSRATWFGDDSPRVLADRVSEESGDAHGERQWFGS